MSGLAGFVQAVQSPAAGQTVIDSEVPKEEVRESDDFVARVTCRFSWCGVIGPGESRGRDFDRSHSPQSDRHAGGFPLLGWFCWYAGALPYPPAP